MPLEPLIHSHITDVLPDNHPLANKQVHCERCRALVHAFNNECMQTWLETGQGNYCILCFLDVKRLDQPGPDALAVWGPEWGLTGA